MRRIFTILALAAALCVPSFGQLRILSSTPNASGLPSKCNIADIFYKTSATAGLYVCTAANTWTILSTGAGGSGPYTPSTFTSNGILYGNGTSSIQVTTQGAANTVLAANAGAPAFSAAPTIGTSVTTPLIAGGAAASSTLTLESTSGAGTTDSIAFKTGSQSTAVTIDTSQNVGIGTVTPLTKLYVLDTSSSSPRGIQSAQVSADTNGARFGCSKARGTPGSEAIVVTGDVLCRMMVRGYDGSNYLEMGSIEVDASDTVASTRVPTQMVLSTATNAAPSVLTTALTLNSSQNATFAGNVRATALGVNTASGPAGTLTSTGQFLGGNGLVGTPTYSFSGNPVTGIYLGATNQIGIAINSAMQNRIGAAHLDGFSGLVLGWSNSSTDASATIDTGISRDAAGVVDLGTGAQGSKAGLLNLAGIVVGQGTITTDVQGLAITTTANSSSVTFTQSKHTLVDTASAVGTKLDEWFAGASGTTSIMALRKDGLLTVGNTVNVATGGSTTISTGVGSVKMSTGNAATNTAWIPISYAGTTYYVPAFATNAP